MALARSKLTLLLMLLMTMLLISGMVRAQAPAPPAGSGVPSTWMAWVSGNYWNYYGPLTYVSSAKTIGSCYFGAWATIYYSGTYYSGFWRYTPCCSSTGLDVYFGTGNWYNVPSTAIYQIYITSTSVSCTPTSFTTGGSTTCTATVTGSGPSGTVTFTTSDPSKGSFGSSSCTLSSGSCTSTYTDTAAGSTPTISAAYGGDSHNTGSTGTTTLTVTAIATIVKTSTTTSVSCPATTAGTPTPCAATVTGNAPVGTVTLTTSDTSTGSFTASGTGSGTSAYTCTLFAGACTVYYVDTAAGSTPTITAAYGGDTYNLGGSGTTTVAIGSYVPLSASPAPTTSPSAITNGQSTTTLTVSAPTGGALPYTYIWYSGTSPTCTSDTATTYTGLSQTFTPSSSTYYCVKETDSLGSAVYTATTQVPVDAAFFASSAPTASDLSIDSGQPSTLTVSAPTGGTPPYTYLWYSGTSPTCASDTDTTYVGMSQTFTPSSSTYYCVQEADSLGGAVYTATTQVAVNPAFVASSSPTASSYEMNNGQSSTLTVSAPTGGTPPYTYVWYAGTSSTCAGDAATTPIYTTLSQTFTPTFSTYYCVQETDSAKIPDVVYTGTTQVTVEYALTASPAPVASNSVISSSGQSSTLTISAPTGGTPPYSYTWYSGTSPDCASDTSTGSGGLSQTVKPSSSTYYCVQETDSAHIPEVVYTDTTQVSINPTSICAAITTPPQIIANTTAQSQLIMIAALLMSIMLFISIAAYMLGRAFDINLLTKFSKEEMREVAVTALIVIVFIGSFSVVSSTAGLGSFVSRAATQTAAPNVFDADCNTLATSSFGMINNWLTESVYQQLFFVAGAVYIAIQPGDFGPAFNPLSGLSLLTDNTDGVITNFALFTGMFSILLMAIAVLLGIFYALFPLFFYVGIVLRTIPFTRAAGGAFIGLFIAFYFVFPFLLYFFLSPYSQAAVAPQTLPSLTSIAPASVSSNPLDIASDIASGMPTSANGAIFPAFITNVVEPFMYTLLAVVFSLMMSMDFMEALGDMLGSPALSNRHALRGLI